MNNKNGRLSKGGHKIMRPHKRAVAKQILISLETFITGSDIPRDGCRHLSPAKLGFGLSYGTLISHSMDVHTRP